MKTPSLFPLSLSSRSAFPQQVAHCIILTLCVAQRLQNGEQPWKLVGDTSKLFDKPAPLPEKEEEPENSVLAGGKKRKADEAELDDKDKDKAKKYKQEGDTIVLEDSDDDEPGGNAAVIHIDSD